MSFFSATQSTWFLIGPIAWVLGQIMNWIFEFLYVVGIPNVGTAIILFTIVVKALMIPMSIRQQKYSKLQSVMAPELQAIQKKYKGKTDNASVMAQQAETKEVYEKYGTSATGGCLQLLIQMPIMLALYQVILHIPGYVTKIYNLYEGVANKLTAISGYADNAELIELIKGMRTVNAANIQPGAQDSFKYIIDMLYGFTQEGWEKFLTIFNNEALTQSVLEVEERIRNWNYFLGCDLAMSPWEQLTKFWPIVFIPILSGVLQWLSTKLAGATQQQPTDDSNPLGGSMKTMNVIFPIMSVVFCFTFPTGLGLYWVASSGVQCIVQLFVNRYINKVDINELVKKNIEKANEKRAKKGLPPKKVTNVTNNVRILEEEKKQEENRKKSLAERAREASEYYEKSSTAKRGSLAEKAGMVQQYEDRVREQKSGKKN